MLLGRTRELAVLESLVEGARSGRGGTAVLRGEAGIGKTRLADEVAARATGFTVLRARGSELESQLPFAGASELVAPLAGRLGRLPPVRAEALAGALGLGPPTQADRFAVYLGLVALLRDAAADAPVLVVADDVHWIDVASSEAITFAARRLQGSRIMFLMAARAGRPPPPLPHANEIALGGLDAAAAAALLSARAPAPVEPDVALRLHAATQGNPLALSELGLHLSAPQLAGRHPIPDPLPLSQGVAVTFVRRAGSLSEPARRLLVLVAAAGVQAAAALPTAARASGLALDLLEESERAGLVVVGAAGPIFSHPLMRSAVYYSADPHERRAAHRALAAALEAAGPPELRAWHLAAAALGPDEATAAALDAAADRAALRSAFGVAAGARERAAELSPAVDDRARRLLGAAREWMLAGRLDRAAGLADGAAAEATPGPLRDDARGLAGRLALLRGSTRLAAEILLAEADAPGQEPTREAALLCDAVVALVTQGDLPAALATARRAARAADASGDAAVARSSRAALGAALVATGRGRDGAPLLIAHADALEAGGEGDPVDALAVRALVWAGEAERADALLTRRIAALRGRGALGHLGFALATQVELDLRAARWRLMVDRADEVLALSRDTGQGWVLHTALRELAVVAAVQGRDEDCRTLVEEMQRMSEDSDMASRLSGLAVLGLLELGLGHADRAVANLEEAAWTARGLHGLREPNVRRWAPDLIEACIHAGRPEAARRELELLEREATTSAAPWTHAVTGRCRGMLAGAAEADRHFGEALVRHGPTAEPFERARTELCFGERRRRLRRRAQAREPLESALATFTRLGARPWADRAAAELAAAGGAALGPPGEVPDPAPQAGPLGAMTAQERRLAALVAAGATNREVAASVHLSTKTVEEHLSRLYRKLGVRSRTELASVMAGTRGGSRTRG